MSENQYIKARRIAYLLLAIETTIFSALVLRLYLEGGFWSAALRSIGIFACLALVFQVLVRLFMSKYRDHKEEERRRLLSVSDIVMLPVVMTLMFGLYLSSEPSVVSRLTLIAICLEPLNRFWRNRREDRVKDLCE